MNRYAIIYEDCSQNESCLAKDGEVFLEIFDMENNYQQVWDEHLK